MYKVLIIPLEEKHAETSWKWRNDQLIWEYTGNRPDIEISPEIEKQWIQNVLKDKASKRFAITVDDIYVGNIQLTNITQHSGQYHAFIGEKEFWGKGISFIASQQVIRYAKNVLNLERIYLKVHPNHERAIKLYKKSGFRIISSEIEMELNISDVLVPAVSVFCMVYNHEFFLRECLESLLMQRTNFDYEIVVGEDCSTDESRKVLLDYSKRFPGKFKLLLHNQNVGAKVNQRMVFDNCNGKYIAICEGDDFWNEPHKLQAQTEFLEKNEDCSFCFHASKMLYPKTEKTHIKRPKHIPENGKFGIKDVIKYGGGFVTTNSILMRRTDNLKQPKWVRTAPVGDLPLLLILASNGQIGYIDQVMSTYRIFSSSGAWSAGQKTFVNRRTHYLRIQRMWQEFDEWSERKYTWHIKLKLLRNLFNFCKFTIKNMTRF